MNINLKIDKIKIIKIKDKNYPEKLMHIYAKPQVLYVLGNVELLNEKAIAIVGCRNFTEYGRINAYKFAFELAKQGICIISGMAKGIDTFAHLGALDAKGKTVAVLGSGLDEVYPSENMWLYKDIIRKNGAVITEYPIGTKPAKPNFPIRNRIISGLSEGVLVIEARRRSGTMITVNHALEQGKDVYALPGNIFSDNSYGTNMLIKEGAIPVTEVNDILSNLL